VRTPKTAIITGADEKYFWLLAGLIQSLRQVDAHAQCDLVVLDFGLTSEQVCRLRDDWSVSVVAPECVIDIPPKFALPRFFGFSLRCKLPYLVPGYDVYLWMDSDTWVQDDLFIQALLAAAQKGKLAIVPETEPAYSVSLTLTGWNLKNQVRGYGLRDGLRVFAAPPINSGVFAARGDHPVWKAWEARFLTAVRRADKVVAMDQHSLKAAICLDRLEVEYMDTCFNWICSRSAPMFDPQNQHFCVPRPPFTKLSVVHLAGNSKAPEIVVPLLGGGSTTKSVLFEAGERLAPSLP
jgi:lipopolysaccharide biosynthesis glycosyltransferase